MNDDVTPPGTVRSRLRGALPAAMKARDMTAVAALRSALGAIDNAEAVDTGLAPSVTMGDSEIANAATGLGAGDVDRRALSESQIADIVRAEVTDRRAAAAEYERAGQRDHAGRLRGEADVLSAYVTPGA